MIDFDLKSFSENTDVEEYDVVIIGGGPGGITAGIYTVQAGLRPVVIEKAIEGGMMNNTELVENWPGTNSIRGMELSEKMADHAKEFGVKFIGAEVVDVKTKEDKKVAILDNGKEIKGKVLIISTGSRPRLLNSKGEKEFMGKGVSYCATCDGHFFKDKEIIVVGGGNSALDEALFLTKIVKKITVVQNLAYLTADKLLQKKLSDTGKVDYIFSSVVKEIKGDKFVNKLIILNTETNEEKELDTEGIFVFVGLSPNTEFLKDKIPLNKWGYIEADETMETSRKGIYAVGDVRSKEIRQIVTAAADGAIAASHAARKYF
ncbi:MAG: thioredoxin reductase [Kosmotogales bacterium]|nr:thioredoxin reductase [Kosmotogales bacterium]